MNKKFLSILGATAISGALLVGCGSAEVEKVDNDNGSETAKKEETKKEEKKSEFKVGETVSIDGMEVTVNSVSWGEANEYVPTTNAKVLKLEVSAKNNSADNGFIDSSEFQVYDAEGNLVEMYFGNDNANMFGGELKKGKQMSGVLEYDVPESESFEIYYEPSFTLKENSEVKWIVPAADVQ
jgi:Domain of unknown function (DUF4352)